MPVNGETPYLDGDLGKLFVGNKRALEEMNHGAGETVVGTRSVTKAKKVGGQDNPISSSESDELLYKKFLEWAEKNKKTYKTADEEKKRFNIWCSTKEWCDANTSHVRGGVKYGLTVFADMTPEECGKLRGAGAGRKSAEDRQDRSWEKSYWESEAGKAVTEEKEAFNKWVAEHKKDYGSMLAWRIMAFIGNRRKIKLLREENPGCYLTLPKELDMKMDRELTKAEFDRLVNLKAGPSNL